MKVFIQLRSFYADSIKDLREVCLMPMFPDQQPAFAFLFNFSTTTASLKQSGYTLSSKDLFMLSSTCCQLLISFLTCVDITLQGEVAFET